MIGFTSRWRAPMLLALIACVASAQDPQRGPAATTAIQDVTPLAPPTPFPIEDRRLPGSTRSSGQAKWTTELARQVYAVCPGEALIEALDRGVDLVEANDRMTGDCARNTLFVRNDSDLAIQCRTRIVYDRPDHAGDTRPEEDRVIFPHTEDASIISYANAGNEARTFTASCFAITVPPAPYVHRPECKPSLDGPSPDTFYPPGPKHRREQGTATLEYRLTANGMPADVHVVISSGIAELDSAALKYAKYLHAKSETCTGQRTRFRVAFRMVD
jgi:TonB family protein